MKRFSAIYNDPNTLAVFAQFYAREASYDIIAEDKDRAKELLTELGENADDYDLEENGVAKDQMGRYFPESIKECSL